MIEVGFRASTLGTRTAIDTDGLGMKWVSDDKVALWATGAEGAVLSAHPFTLHYGQVDPSEAYFTSTIEAMRVGTYTYYAAYPLPSTTSGTSVSYNISAVQTPQNVWDNAIMIGEPTTASALGDKQTSDLSLVMKHMTHALKFFYTAVDNGFDDKVTMIRVDFPRPVAGTVAADAADPTSGLTLSGTQQTITINIPDGLDYMTDNGANSTAAYAIIAPINLSAQEQITITAYSDRQQQTFQRSGRDFAAGHVTPVRLRLDAPTQSTMLRLYMAANNLGEEPTRVTVSADDGTALGSDGATDLVIEADNSYFVNGGYYNWDVTALPDLSNKSLTVTYESESAIVREHLTLPSIASAGTTSVALTVPYLMYEDFSGISSDFSHNDTFRASDSSNPSAVWLDDYGLVGWSAARVGGSTGNCIRICSRFETGLWIAAYYNGRADSAPISTIKSGHSVRVRVTFSAGGEVYVGTGSSDAKSICQMGSTHSTAANNGSVAIELQAASETLDNNGSYTSTPSTYQYEIDACNAATRLSWRVTTNRAGAGAGNGNYWAYIDNVRVQIITE